MSAGGGRRAPTVDEPVPDLAAEALDGFRESFFDPAVFDPPPDDVIADPLPPADDSAVGVFDVEEAISKARRVTLYSGSGLGPVQVTREQLRALVRSVRNAPDPVIVTARFEGPDLVVRTLEFMPSVFDPDSPSPLSG